MPRIDARLSVSRVRDPLVLAAELSVLADRNERLGTGVALSAGFVANDRSSLTAEAAHVFWPDGRAFPATTVAVGVQHWLDGEARRAVTFRASMTATGPEIRLGFEAALIVRGRVERQ
ncbi:MAG: hypothetical protein H0Z37_00360 [Firmicutes bacterium]|nr:hypothetical protein [Bacillota bacterium]